MKVTLSQGIETMSGKSNGVLFKTYNRPNGKKETRAYILPVKDVSPTGKKTYGYKRQSALSKNEIGVRNKFTIVSRRIKNLTDEQRQQYAKEWKAAKYKFNGKKYVTLRGYIMARLYAETPAGE
jgi:hypothetical protein